MKDIVEGIQVAHGDVREARVDVTTSLLKSGYIDMMLAILKEFVRPKQFVVALPQASAWLASTERHH